MSRPLDLASFPMLRRCGAPGCTTVVFGVGTCLQHDAPGEGAAAHVRLDAGARRTARAGSQRLRPTLGA